MQTNNYSRQQVEEMLPDYVFGQLTAAERAEFERAAQGYPEILREVEEVRAVFSRVEKMDIQASIDQRTRNLSVKVHQRLGSEKQKSTRPLFLRFALPALAAAAAVMFMMYSPWGTHDNTIASIDAEIEGMINKDAAELFMVIPATTPKESDTAPTSTPSLTAAADDSFDALLAEATTIAAGQQDDREFLETEQLHLQNTIEINDVEQMIKELDDASS